MKNNNRYNIPDDKINTPRGPIDIHHQYSLDSELIPKKEKLKKESMKYSYIERLKKIRNNISKLKYNNRRILSMNVNSDILKEENNRLINQILKLCEIDNNTMKFSQRSELKQIKEEILRSKDARDLYEKGAIYDSLYDSINITLKEKRQDSRIEREKKEKIRERIRKIAAIAIAVALSSPLAFSATKKQNKISSLNTEVETMISNTATGRTEDNSKPDWNYREIAENLLVSDDFDSSLYSVIISFEHTTSPSVVTNPEYVDASATMSPEEVVTELNNILQYTNYKTFDNYLEIKGYADLNDFKKDIKKKLDKMDNQALEDMINDYQEINQEAEEKTEGGKTI